jgi:hypothetical protein
MNDSDPLSLSVGIRNMLLFYVVAGLVFWQLFC